jgi:hypothetical protein
VVVPLPAYLNCAYGSDVIFKEESHGEGHVDHAVRTTERKWIVLIEFHRFLDRLNEDENHFLNFSKTVLKFFLML